MIYFCTYFDENYLSRFLALNKSLSSFNFSYTFYILALDKKVLEFFRIKEKEFNESLDEFLNKFINRKRYQLKIKEDLQLKRQLSLKNFLPPILYVVLKRVYLKIKS